MSALDEHLKRHRQRIIDREEKTFREMLAAYSEVEKELKKSFDALQRQIEEAQAKEEIISPSWFFRESRLRKLLAQVQRQITEFGGTATKIIEREQRAAIKIAITQAQENFDFAISGTNFNSRDLGSMLNPRTVETAVGMLGDGSPIISYFEQQLAPLVAGKIKSEVITASAIGTDFKTIAKRLQETGGITKHRALSVVRTATSKARLIASLTAYKHFGIVKYMRVSAKRIGTCVLCLGLDSTIYDVGEVMPTHLNCRCLTIPMVGFLQRETAQEWVLTLPKEKQKEILGNGYFEVWEKRKFDLKDLVKFRRHKNFGERLCKKSIAEISG